MTKPNCDNIIIKKDNIKIVHQIIRVHGLTETWIYARDLFQRGKDKNASLTHAAGNRLWEQREQIIENPDIGDLCFLFIEEIENGDFNVLVITHRRGYWERWVVDDNKTRWTRNYVLVRLAKD